MNKRDCLQTVNVFSVQSPVVTEKLMKTGIAVSKKEYVVEKYGESAALFTTVYDWFCRKVKAQKLVELPDQCDLYPYWVFFDLQNTTSQPEDHILSLQIPSDQCVFFRCDEWTKILQLGFLHGDPADVHEMRACGIDCRKAVLTSFYPEWRQRILDSWDSLLRFDEQIKHQLNCCPDPAGQALDLKDFQAAVFQLRKEWLIQSN